MKKIPVACLVLVATATAAQVPPTPRPPITSTQIARLKLLFSAKEVLGLSVADGQSGHVEDSYYGCVAPRTRIALDLVARKPHPSKALVVSALTRITSSDGFCNANTAGAYANIHKMLDAAAGH